MESAMHRIGFVVSPGFQMMSFAAMSAFEFANLSVDPPLYDVRVLSQTGGQVPTSMGMLLDTGPLDDTPYDTVIFGGGLEGAEATPEVIEFVHRSVANARRVASICTGA